MKHSVAIIGCSAHSLEGYYHDEWSQTWCINSAWKLLDNKPDLIIAMDDLERDWIPDQKYVEGIVFCGCPVFAAREYPQWPNTRAYPREQVMASIPSISTTRRHLMLNTVNYSLALAIWAEYSRVGLYGCDFTRRDDPDLLEYGLNHWRHGKYPHAPDWFKYYDSVVQSHRQPTEPGEPTTAFLIGIARERGIEIVISPASTLMDHDRPSFYYGYQEQPE